MTVAYATPSTPILKLMTNTKSNPIFNTEDNIKKKRGKRMKVYCEKDYDQASRRAANVIAAQVLLKPDCVLGLATGSTPVGAYKELIAKCEKGDIDFSKVRSVNLDEYKGLS